MTAVNLTASDIDEVEAQMKLHETDANNVNARSLKYRDVCEAARSWLTAQSQQRSAKVQKAQPVEAPKPAVVGGPDADLRGDSK